MQVTTKWQNDMTFISNAGTVQDYLMEAATVDQGSPPKGAAPKHLVLMGLTGCTGMDVISILNKMKLKITRFELSAEAEIAKDHPMVFTRIRLKYLFSGSDLDLDKLNKAVSLSLDKYCSVTAMLKPTVKIEHEIVIV